MTARVADLIPGDLVTQGNMSAVFIVTCRHPLWPTLQLVIWRLDNDEWSHDALSILQEVGEIISSTKSEREARLRAALVGGRTWD